MAMKAMLATLQLRGKLVHFWLFSGVTPRNSRRNNVPSEVDENCYLLKDHRPQEAKPADFGLHHNKFLFQTAADLHGDSMKKKLDPIRTFDRAPRSLLSSPSSEPSRRSSHDPRLPPALNVPVQLPIHSRSMLQAPAMGLTNSPVFSASSPRSTAFRPLPTEQRQLREALEFDRSPRSRSRRNNSDDASAHGGYDYHGAEDMEIDDATSPKRLHPEETHSTVGHKRRAASPPAGDLIHCGAADIRRRELSSRGSPTPRLSLMPQPSSVSTMSSAALSRSNSYISTMSMAPSSITTATSFGRRSPGATSPGGVSPTSCNSSYTTPASLTHSPRNSISGRATTHARTISGTSPRKLSDIQKPTGSKVQRVFMCECCPKKPKKFETAEKLR